ncbi:MAG: hypothetical protein AAGU14_04070 [Eubacteriaceae bacterium]
MEKVKKDKMFTSVSVGAATVWFSTHCGAGFASGTQELNYFANHAWYGPFLPLLTIAIIAITYYVGVETARQTGKWDYHSWSLEAYKPIGTVGSILLEIAVVVTVIAASAACISAGANLGVQSFGWPMWVGSVLMFAIIVVLSIFGEKVVRNNAMIMTIGIIIIVLVVLIAGLIKFGPVIGQLISDRYVNPASAKWGITGAVGTTPGNFGNAFLWALTYAGFQMGIIAGSASAFKGAKSKKESKGFAILGYILNAAMLTGVCFLLLGGMPGIWTDKAARTLPTLYMVGQLNMPILKVLYPIMLFLALVTTAVGLTFGMVERLSPYMFKKMSNVAIKKGIIALGVLLVCWAVSTLGLMWVVQVAYKYLGIFNWFAVILPLWIFGFKNIKARDKAAKVSE